MGNMKEFFTMLENLISFFDDLIELQNKKLDIIVANDVDELDRCINQEQAYAMQLKGYDRKREKMQEELGFAQVPLREIVEKCEGEERKGLDQLYQVLHLKTQELRAANDCVNKFIEMRIEVLDGLIEEQNQIKNNQ
ncbi:MAG: flagellar protein FlgN [Oscillospiraceae bacterium]|nr:flagellar protein FlgN [Oscillospiraceae bacterium]